MKSWFLLFFCLTGLVTKAQIQWVQVDSLFGPLPPSIQVFRTDDTLDGKPNIAYYVIADMQDRELEFEADTANGRRLTPRQFFERNASPHVVVNTTFFSFQTNQNLNAVVMEGNLVGYNIHSMPGRGKDTLTFRHSFGSAIGITKNRQADIAWLFTDSSRRRPYALQSPVKPLRDSIPVINLRSARRIAEANSRRDQRFRKWKVETAVGGGPALLQNGEVAISNNEELRFAGKAINDKHPRTAMGYTKDKKLIILVVQGRAPGIAEGVDLVQLARMLKEIGCVEALNLDGGGSSCMLVNGKETIIPSDKGQQRPVPSVFVIRARE